MTINPNGPVRFNEPVTTILPKHPSQQKIKKISSQDPSSCTQLNLLQRINRFISVIFQINKPLSQSKISKLNAKQGVHEIALPQKEGTSNYPRLYLDLKINRKKLVNHFAIKNNLLPFLPLNWIHSKHEKLTQNDKLKKIANEIDVAFKNKQNVYLCCKEEGEKDLFCAAIAIYLIKHKNKDHEYALGIIMSSIPNLDMNKHNKILAEYLSWAKEQPQTGPAPESLQPPQPTHVDFKSETPPSSINQQSSCIFELPENQKAPPPSKFRKLMFLASVTMRLFRRIVRQEKTWNEINIPVGLSVPNNARFGIASLPNSDTEDADEFQQNGVATVISVTEPFENQNCGPSHPYSSDEWKAKGIKHIVVEANDHELLSIEQLEILADAIHDAAQKNRQNALIMVHCNGGKGRSPMALAAYFIKYHKCKPEQIAQKIKDSRPQSTIFNKLVRLQEFRDHVTKTKVEAQLTTYKELKPYPQSI